MTTNTRIFTHDCSYQKMTCMLVRYRLPTNSISLGIKNRWWAKSDMDAEDLAKAALGAIDEWLKEEIVGFEPA